MVWWAVTAFLVVWLFLFTSGPSAIGGGFTIGAVIGIAIAAFQPVFLWSTVGKTMVIAASVGFVFDLLPRLVGLRAR